MICRIDYENTLKCFKIENIQVTHIRLITPIPKQSNLKLSVSTDTTQFSFIHEDDDKLDTVSIDLKIGSNTFPGITTHISNKVLN